MEGGRVPQPESSFCLAGWDTHTRTYWDTHTRIYSYRRLKNASGARTIRGLVDENRCGSVIIVVVVVVVIVLLLCECVRRKRRKRRKTRRGRGRGGRVDVNGRESNRIESSGGRGGREREEEEEEEERAASGVTRRGGRERGRERVCAGVGERVFVRSPLDRPRRR